MRGGVREGGRRRASGSALVAVGGYGRRELAPHSDLDVVLVLDEGVEPGEVAERLWYPLWDSGTTIDHSVRDAARDARRRRGRPPGRAGPARRAAPGRRRQPDPAAARHGARAVAPQRPRAAAGPARAGARPPRAGGRAGAPVGARREGGRGRAARRDRAARPWSRPGWSTCRTPTSSAAGRRCSTSATWCRPAPGAPATASTPEMWSELATGLGMTDAAQRPGARAQPWAGASPTCRG